MSSTRDRPNILWLTYEDTSPQFVSCYGMTRVQTTPVIDSLAADGVRFDHA
jgi:arylsulfatase A-like enzyme